MAITKQFILPVTPVQTHLKSIYPWEEDYFKLFYNALYQRAVKTGYNGTFESFRDNIGKFLSIAPYEGSYNITPFIDIDQILQTSSRLLTEDIIVNRIPFAQTSNLAGGYTVTIG